MARGGGEERPARPSGGDRLYELSGLINEGNRTICRLLLEHRVLTTSQAADMGVGSLPNAQERRALVMPSWLGPPDIPPGSSSRSPPGAGTGRQVPFPPIPSSRVATAVIPSGQTANEAL